MRLEDAFSSISSTLKSKYLIQCLTSPRSCKQHGRQKQTKVYYVGRDKSQTESKQSNIRSTAFQITTVEAFDANVENEIDANLRQNRACINLLDIVILVR